MSGRAIIVRGAPVSLPAPLALRPEYPTLAELERRFLASLAHRPTKTGKTYRDGMRRWSHFLAAAGVDVLEETADVLPDDVLEHFWRWLVESGYGRASVATYVSGVLAFWRFVTAKRLVPARFSYDAMRNGLREQTGRKSSYRSPRLDPNLARLVAHVLLLPVPDARQRGGVARLEVLRDNALIATLYSTGTRRAEAISLNRQDVRDGHASEALITGKGDKQRHIYFDEAAQAAICAYLEARHDNYAPLFLRHDNHRGRPGPGAERWRLGEQSAWKVVRQYANELGIRATTHHLRHLRASVWLNNGASLSEVQDLLGHASPETTKRVYAHYTPKVLRAAFDRASVPAAQLVADHEYR